MIIPRYRNLDLFAAGAQRMAMDEAIAITRQSLMAYGASHRHWCIAWSGGKDSTATLSLTLWMLQEQMVEAPDRLTVFYADTRMELPPLAIAAEQIMARLRQRNIEVHRVMAPMDLRFMVYMLGRGVPPPNNGTLRWCTRQIKIDPMQSALAQIITDSALMITGVRQGESAIRDRRIEMSCSKDGAECGQGWYQTVLPNSKHIRGRLATLAPILHWRVCHIWEWLRAWAPKSEYGGLPTDIIAAAYGGDEAEEVNARTGCIGCPLAQRDAALETIIAMPQWSGLSPLLELKPLYRELREDRKHRIRKHLPDRLKSGGIAKNPQRIGPLKLASRQWALERILTIQGRCHPPVDLINAEEESRIRQLITDRTFPRGWTGDEQGADQPLAAVYYQDGAEQPTLWGQ